MAGADIGRGSEDVERVVAVLSAHLPRDRYDDDGASVGTYCTCGGWEGDYFADGEAGPFDTHLATHVVPLIEQARREGAVEERDRWTLRLANLCDDDWLRQRDRAMDIDGTRAHRWGKRAASAWESAARDVRAVLNDFADYENTYAGRHESYSRWLRGGRDRAERAAQKPQEATSVTERGLGATNGPEVDSGAAGAERGAER
jgi:hypothetical protein